MKAGWEVKQLGAVISLEYGKPLEASDRDLNGLYPVYGANGEISRTNKFYYDKSSIIVGRKGSAGEINLTETKFWPLDVTYFVKLDQSLNDLQFIYYLLESLELRSFAKGVKPGINRNEVYSLEVKIPSKLEQLRIVAILDQAFEGIAKARANAEQNLQNARALFESHLQSLFSQCGESWINSTISEFINFIDYRGKTPVKTASGLRLITAKNVKMGYLQDEPKEYVAPDIYKSWMTRGIPQRGDVLFTTEAPLANVAQLNTEEKVVFAQRIIIMQADPTKLNSTFLKYLLLSSPIQSRIHEQATGATAQGIKASLLKKIKISFPNTILKQQEIVTQLDALVSKRHRLESIYQRKIVLLDELKKSLLQQAFAGELTSNFDQSGVIPFQPSLPKPMSSTDVHAGVLALSYQKHEENGNVINFAHVKAEKIAHMIEARLGIDLGRTPIKDAAGPNDYPHLKIVESRARKAGYFDFKQVDGAAYRVVKLSKFDDLANKTRAFLAEKMPKIDELLELMLPMDTQQAEIFCTVYAAWNNLLLDGQEPTDENIVFEARENWHPDKLKIPREKFFGAIDWMRNKKVFPHGTGKKVLAKK